MLPHPPPSQPRRRHPTNGVHAVRRPAVQADFKIWISSLHASHHGRGTAQGQKTTSVCCSESQCDRTRVGPRANRARASLVMSATPILISSSVPIQTNGPTPEPVSGIPRRGIASPAYSSTVRRSVCLIPYMVISTIRYHTACAVPVLCWAVRNPKVGARQKLAQKLGRFGRSSGT